jgi:hypothetical protein
MARNNAHFDQGRSTFICGVCGRRTRIAGQPIDSECCLECYELAGLDNTVNDGICPVAEVAGERDALLLRAMRKGSNGARIRQSFNFLFPPEQTTMRTISEIHEFDRAMIERLLMQTAKLSIIGPIYKGQFGEQTLRWNDDGSATVTTTHTPD